MFFYKLKAEQEERFLLLTENKEAACWPLSASRATFLLAPDPPPSFFLPPERRGLTTCPWSSRAPAGTAFRLMMQPGRQETPPPPWGELRRGRGEGQQCSEGAWRPPSLVGLEEGGWKKGAKSELIRPVSPWLPFLPQARK